MAPHPGLGAAVIIDQINRSQQQQPRQQQTNRPQQPAAQGAPRQQQAAPRIDPARQAAMDLQRDLNALGFDAGPVDQFTISAILPGTDILLLPRDEASAFLNAHQARLAGRERLVRVVWGRLTRLGIDESMNAFATPNVAGAGRGAAKPAAFVPERVTLHYTGAQRESRMVTRDTPVVREWQIGPGAAGETGADRDALALARELGLPIEDGHVVAGQGAEEAWRTFRNLARVDAYPDAACRSPKKACRSTSGSRLAAIWRPTRCRAPASARRPARRWPIFDAIRSVEAALKETVGTADPEIEF